MTDTFSEPCREIVVDAAMLVALSLGFVVVAKPIGLFLSAPDPTAIANSTARGTLIRVRWDEIESEKGQYSFAAVRRQLDRVKSADKDWSLGIVAGQHAPSWLSDDASIPVIKFDFRRTTTVKVPVQWNAEVQKRLKLLAQAAAKEFGDDAKLKLVYVPQMTANGIEGHFNGCPNQTIDEAGYTEDKWVSGVEQTAADFAAAFPTKALAVEVHEVERSAKPATRIMNDLWNNKALGHRVGVAMWWLSGRTSYQGDLVKAIKDFPGDKYAQVIARSSDSSQFEDGDFKSVFRQARELGIRYIEPWEVEFKGSSFDDTFKDFNSWADKTFGKS
ncbi:MAG: hypothetical protein JST12_17395 [Armatimonadetes bacterium]|nr:hypothetical protein [Armatimonadota bacterium]